MKEYNTLAIIGNGFDLAHGLNTRFSDFVFYVMNEGKDDSIRLLVDYFSEIRRFAATSNPLVLGRWLDFEFCAEEMVRAFAEKERQNEQLDYEKLKNEIRKYNEIFASLNNCILQYLRETIDTINIEPIDALIPYLQRNTIAFNFNYTNTISKYECDNYYVHGSVDENNIIIGYDNIDDGSFCWSDYEYRRWLKTFERQKLSFIRSMRNIGVQELELKKLEAEYIKFSIQTGTSRGCEESDFIGYDQRICNYEKNGYDDYSKELLKNIRKVVVAGHSINADACYLKDDVFDNVVTTQIESVIVFLHSSFEMTYVDDVTSFFESVGISKNKVHFEKYENNDKNKEIIDFLNNRFH